jgi:hypothetical protein
MKTEKILELAQKTLKKTRESSTAITNVSIESLRNWLAGANDPRLLRLLSLASERDVEWIVDRAKGETVWAAYDNMTDAELRRLLKTAAPAWLRVATAVMRDDQLYRALTLATTDQVHWLVHMATEYDLDRIVCICQSFAPAKTSPKNAQ